MKQADGRHLFTAAFLKNSLTPGYFHEKISLWFSALWMAMISQAAKGDQVLIVSR